MRTRLGFYLQSWRVRIPLLFSAWGFLKGCADWWGRAEVAKTLYGWLHIGPLHVPDGVRAAVAGLGPWLPTIAFWGGIAVALYAARSEGRRARRPGGILRAFNVLWMDLGETDDVTGDAVIGGPVCPTDQTALLFRDFFG